MQSPLQNAANHNIRTTQSSDIKSDGPTVDANPAKHFIKVRSELLNDYEKNPEVICGAFPAFSPWDLLLKELGVQDH